ncbi:hypothetical protein TB2_016640 [Malus domestica]
MAFRSTNEKSWVEWMCVVKVNGWKTGADGWRKERRWIPRLEERSWRRVGWDATKRSGMTRKEDGEQERCLATRTKGVWLQK